MLLVADDIIISTRACEAHAIAILVHAAAKVVSAAPRPVMLAPLERSEDNVPWDHHFGLAVESRPRRIGHAADSAAHREHVVRRIDAQSCGQFSDRDASLNSQLLNVPDAGPHKSLLLGLAPGA
jgi:hypothetical protein